MISKYLKQIGIGYFIFGILMIGLAFFNKISVFPVILGVLAIMLYFMANSIIALFKSNSDKWVDFGILWAISILFSSQILLLLSDKFKVYALVTATIVIFFILFLSYRYKKQSDIPFFVFMIAMTLGSLNTNF